jgi:serine protease Do
MFTSSHKSHRILSAAFMMLAAPLAAQTVSRPLVLPTLTDLDNSIQALTNAVGPSVVQVLVSGYRPAHDVGREAGVVFTQQRSIGSGAIIDGDGYIVTNAHVVAGAQQISVALHAVGSVGPLQSLASNDGVTVPAKIVGMASDIDLALLKIDRTGLRPLPLADYDKVRQGALVFAFGSPDGLGNSVTMGVVSASARQTDPDSPNLYIQTDAPINAGNSGGPLVNVRGELVGLNTFILTESGGSQGLGFAIPSLVIAAAYPQLKMYGHLRRRIIGANVQAITPAMANAFNLPRSSGVIVSDVLPDLPAAAAGLRVRDVVTAIDGKAIDNVPMFTLALNTRFTGGETITLDVLRNSHLLALRVGVIEQPREIDQLGELGDPVKNAVPKLGIIGADIDESTKALLPKSRIPFGVLVTARREDSNSASPLLAGDVIHEFNGITIRSLDALRVMSDGLTPRGQAVLQIERDGRLMYVTITVH